MYWLPKMHKQPTGKRFIIASKTCSTKQIFKAVSHVFRLIYNQVENFHVKAKFLSNYNKFWVLQNSDPILDILNRINKNKMRNLFQHLTSVRYTQNFLITNSSKSFLKSMILLLPLVIVSTSLFLNTIKLTGQKRNPKV